jgi:hypothetical protein
MKVLIQVALVSQLTRVNYNSATEAQNLSKALAAIFADHPRDVDQRG